MKIRYRMILSFFTAVLASFALTCCTSAQDDPDPAELAKQYSRLRSHRFYRNASSVYDAAIRYAQMDESRITPMDQYLRAFYEGRWDDVRKTLEMLPDDLSGGIYDKMLADLTGRTAPVLTLDDFIGLADACPGELNSNRIRRLGLLLRIAVTKEQQLWLRRALEKGTRHLGASKPKRLTTGRVLMHGNFDDLAREYLPDVVQASRLEDTEARDEIMKFLASQEELEEFQQTQIAGLWEQNAKVVADPDADPGKKQQATDRLADLIGKATTASIEPWIRSLVQKKLDAALRLATSLGKRSQGKINDRDVARRTNNLNAQKAMLLSVAEHTELSKSPWRSIATGMADWWIDEAEHTFEVRPTYRAGSRPKPHVAPGDLLDSAPDGPWEKALPASLRERIDVCLSKAVVVSDRYQDAVDLIVEIAERNPEAGVSMAEEYLQAWAHRHDPHIPEAIRRQHKLSNDARIMVTPIMMEKNIADLGKMMDIFRQNGIQPRNGKLVIDAFDVCYSNAEVYRRSHIESVFGQIDEMDEDVFLQMIRMMTQGLSSRWRKVDVQQASGTGRSQQETLEMVRNGYQTAIDMIDHRSKRHKDAWRILMLAGSLLSHWGDFEFYQQLSGEANVNRMEAFRSKNNLAEEYFTRAAEAYAQHVPNLGRKRYSIDAYLAWFHSLLGINTSGNLNLSKPLDRRVLNKIREMMRQLPKGAGKAHVDMLAKYVNSRMEDTKNPLHEELKYKYLAGSLVITKSSPFSFQASNKVTYYDELLDEIRLETRVDGPNTIHRDHEFGIILCVHHTEAMGRMANFGKYLTNETPATGARSTSRSQSIVTTYKMITAKGRRDEMEINIQESLSLFFDIKSITFSPKDVQPRPTDRPGWEESILAYIHAKAKDCSVDKIPRIQMNLEFLDMTGPVAISAESAETMIKVTDENTPPRPFERVDLTQTLDARNLQTTEEVLLEVKATACGLVPEIEDLLDFDSLDERLPIARIDPQGGTLLRQVNSWGEEVHAVSERQWTIAFDASSLVQDSHRIAFRMPVPKVAETNVTYQAYVDMDLIDLDEPIVTIGEGPSIPDVSTTVASVEPWVLYSAAAGGLALLLIVVAVLVRLIRGPRQRPLRARDVFHVPAEVDAFNVVQLLRALERSELVRLTTRQHSEIQQEIEQIQASCFNGNGSELSDEHLRRVAKKWLKTAC